MTAVGTLLIWTLGLIGAAIGAVFGMLDGRSGHWTYLKVALILLLLLGLPLYFAGDRDGGRVFRDLITASVGALGGTYVLCWILAKMLGRKKPEEPKT
jgi:hypothetical protein